MLLVSKLSIHQDCTPCEDQSVIIVYMEILSTMKPCVRWCNRARPLSFPVQVLLSQSQTNLTEGSCNSAECRMSFKKINCEKICELAKVSCKMQNVHIDGIYFLQSWHAFMMFKSRCGPRVLRWACYGFLSYQIPICTHFCNSCLFKWATATSIFGLYRI